ncbi:MAG: hypothetical protein IJU07_10210, partial [Synergistaceae bacterium]|nr:hypothetical protein [Synergistaceae bacterium]
NDEDLLNSDNPFDSFIYAAKKYSDYMSDDAQKVKLEYLLKITRSLQALGLNTREREGILVLVTRLINLEDKTLRKQYFDELEKLKGESNSMAELTWIEEHFRDKAVSEGITKGIAKGIAIGEARGKEQGRSEILNAAINFMRSNGMTNEQIDSFRNSFLK